MTYPYTLHVGLTAQGLGRSRRALQAVPGAHDRFVVDGDGWEVWGEAVGTDANDDVTLHVTVDVRDRAAAGDLLRQIIADLTPMCQNVANPVVGVITDAADWSALDGVETEGDVGTWRAYDVPL